MFRHIKSLITLGIKTSQDNLNMPWTDLRNVHFLHTKICQKHINLVFAFGKSYVVLLVARAIQGIGSSFASTAGISLLADRFVDDCERGKALGHAIGGLAMGVLCE